VNLLISKGAKLNAADRHYGTPLHAACVAYKINLDCILSLIQAGDLTIEEQFFVYSKKSRLFC